MGMAPTEPHPGILALLNEAETEIRLREQRDDEKTNYVSLETIRGLKHRLGWSDENFEKLLVDGLSVGFLLGITSQGAETGRLEKTEEVWRKFNKKGKTKTNLVSGEKGPGRHISEITRAMVILATKIPPPAPYTYNRKMFIQDLNKHYSCIKDIIKPVKGGDGYIYPRKAGESRVSIEGARSALKKAAKAELI